MVSEVLSVLWRVGAVGGAGAAMASIFNRLDREPTTNSTKCFLRSMRFPFFFSFSGKW